MILITTNTIFYTFSTIAQALAGAIGLIGAFVLFRLQAFNSEMENLAEQIANTFSVVATTIDLRRLGRTAHYDDLLKAVESIDLPAGHYTAKWERDRLPVVRKHRAALLRRFKFALYSTAGLIGVSVTVLTVAEPLSPHRCVAVAVLTVAVVWLVACLLNYVMLVTHSLE